MSAVRVAFVLGFAAVFSAAPAAAQPTPLPKEEQAAADDAVARGVQFLLKEQKPIGSWGSGTEVGDGNWLVGYTAVAGLALAECGVPPTDPALKKAAFIVRGGAPKVDRTYEVALSILFLDRMADPKDKPVIQSLAARLIGGQTQTGGWSYKVPTPAPAEANQVLSALRKMAAVKPSASAFGFRDRPGALGLCIKMSDDIRPKPVSAEFDSEKARTEAVAGLPTRFRGLPVFQDPDKLKWEDPKDKSQEPVGGTTDNSNTHFAVLGLWAARRHDVPTDRSFTLLARRYRSSQDGGGGWGYAYAKGGAGSSPALTCVALLGLAIGNALAVDKDVGARPEADQAVLKAFGMLAGKVGEPAGTTAGRPSVKDAGGLYHLWALERIAVLYDLPTLGNKDWYRWGLEILICHQKLDGSWADGGFPGEHPVINTALALLFLKRANLTPDLSKRLMADRSLIAAKVSEPPKPKAEPPPPVPPVTVVVVEPPSPPPVVAAPPKPQPVVTAAEPPPAPPAVDRPLWPWLLLLLAVLLAAGGGLYFARRRSKGEDEDADALDDEVDNDRPAAAFEVVEDGDDEKPRPKKGKGVAISQPAKRPKRTK